jgi:outer membrane protein assembly factor BamE (lipoprotein component of BamABCDE complex)
LPPAVFSAIARSRLDVFRSWVGGFDFVNDVGIFLGAPRCSILSIVSATNESNMGSAESRANPQGLNKGIPNKLEPPCRNRPKVKARLDRKLILVAMLWMGVMMIGGSGCAFTRGDLGGGAAFTSSNISAIQKGKTTEAQVVALLGAPNSIQSIDHQEVFHYYRYVLKHSTVLVFSRVNIASDDLYVFFDDDGIVNQVLVGNHTNQLKFQFWPFGR